MSNDTGSERFVLVLDSTQITAFDQCPSLWHYGHDMRLDPIGVEAKTAMNIGTYGHKLMELYYKGLASGLDQSKALDACWSYDFDRETCRCGHAREQHVDNYNMLEPSNTDKPTCQHIACKCAAFTPNDFPLELPDRQKTRQRFLEYIGTYSMHDFRPISPDHVEVGFSVPILDTPERLYVLEGRVDLFAEQNGITLFVDHKWQMKRHNLYKKSIQFRNYCLATGLTVGLINYVRMAQKIDKDTFRRDIINFTKMEQDAWREELLNIYDQVEQAIRANNFNDPSMKKRSSCPGRYGYECQFTPICDETNDWVRTNKLNQLYHVRPLWQPWG